MIDVGARTPLYTLECEGQKWTRRNDESEPDFITRAHAEIERVPGRVLRLVGW